jgi:acyl-CoA-dependent ceramide synthase
MPLHPFALFVAYGCEQRNTGEKTRKSKRRRVKSWFRRWKSLSLRHTWLNPLIVCAIVVSIYLVDPSPKNPAYAALFLSYPLPADKNAAADAPRQYGKGPRDFAFVAFYTVFLSFTREFIMQRILRPWSIRAGMRTRGKQSRFMEQAYTAIYFGIFGPFGLYVMSRTPIWYFNTTAMYEGFPHMTHEALFKAYYLLQASYWTQQMIVMLLMLEKPRKDFKELILHHIITIALIGLSYRFHFTYMGLAVYITHDISDFFLAVRISLANWVSSLTGMYLQTSKILNYIDSAIVIPFFLLFLGAWTYLRHYLNLSILVSMLPLPSPFPDPITEQLNEYSAVVYSRAVSVAWPVFQKLLPVLQPLAQYFNAIFPQTSDLLVKGYGKWLTPWEPSQFVTVGSYTLDWTGGQYKCWISHWITFSLLAALQAVNIFWFFLILRILVRVVATLGEDKRDDRSEYDSDEEEEAQRQAELKAGREADLGEKKQQPTMLLNGAPFQQ